MKRVRGQKSSIVRHWIGLFMAAMLAFSPALNLTVVNPAVAAPASNKAGHDASPPADHHHGSADDHLQTPGDCSGLNHLDLKCLQCLALGGMSLAGAEVIPAPAPRNLSVDAVWSFARQHGEPISVHAPTSRGPPSFA